MRNTRGPDAPLAAGEVAPDQAASSQGQPRRRLITLSLAVIAFVLITLTVERWRDRQPTPNARIAL